MRRSGPALRVALLGVATTLAGFTLLGTWLGVHAYAYDSARDRATARADGLVVEDGIGDEGDIRVRWRDDAGHEHVQRFGIYDTDRYAKGRRFPVAYDPHAADPPGFAADPDETAAEDDLVVPIFLAGIAAAVLCGVWARRGLRFHRTARRPGRTMTASVRRGERTGATVWQSDTTWLVLAELDRPDHPVAWQRVMWHPALDTWSGPVTVTAHRGRRGRSAIVVVLPDGTRLVPLGRLWRRPPRHVLLYEPEAVRTDLRDSFLPARTTTRPARPWWRPGALAAAVGAVVGAVAGFAITNGSIVAVVAFALSGASVFAASWALSAPQP
ncbi:hypothetical protein [Streptomyces sp. NBC_01538]|uniref:hypothetical protein n=1 Tax=Streptomyces sp. NBC_01538 TaxID=2903897 RepID=UPI00386A686E